MLFYIDNELSEKTRILPQDKPKIQKFMQKQTFILSLAHLLRFFSSQVPAY